MRNKKKASDRIPPNEQKLVHGIAIIKEHKLFGKLDIYMRVAGKDRMPKGAAAFCYESGDIMINKDESHSPEEWAWIIAHCMLHLCFGHFEAENMPGYYDENNIKDGRPQWVVKCVRPLWNMACDIYICRFLEDIKFGAPICSLDDMMNFSGNERSIYEKLVDRQASADSNIYGTALNDMVFNGVNKWHTQRYGTYASQFAYAVSDSVRMVIDEAGGRGIQDKKSVQTLAAEWFINHYPLLGGLASDFKIIEVGYGSQSASGGDISVAAVNAGRREIYVNSASRLSLEEWKFVLAHEYLHAGLEHHCRCQGRHPYLWNVACDYVINGWLSEMQVGVMPQDGTLYDETLKGCSAEEVYDILVKDLRRNIKLNTLRGGGKPDMLDEGYAESRLRPTSLDDFCKNALRGGLEYHQRNGRGYIPAGLIEEIKALSVPPIPWDVELAKWFDLHFEPLGKTRSYARPSRRQSATPDIPRPSYVAASVPDNSRTYAVIIDTSGSMGARLIGLALGAAASYSVAKEVPYVRVVFCDAAAYDIGYVAPEDIAGRVEVKGRGGTMLQPAIDLIESAKDFPKKGPILIITDGQIEDALTIHREHAFLIPKGKRLPFPTKSKVFYFEGA